MAIVVILCWVTALTRMPYTVFKRQKIQDWTSHYFEIRRNENMKARVNENCIGCGLCVGIAETVFQMNDEDKAEVFGEVTAENLDVVQEAADSCPVSAIEVEE